MARTFPCGICGRPITDDDVMRLAVDGGKSGHKVEMCPTCGAYYQRRTLLRQLLSIVLTVAFVIAVTAVLAISLGQG